MTQHNTDTVPNQTENSIPLNEMFTEKDLKMIALADHLGIDHEDIEYSGEYSEYDDMIFVAGIDEYLVCTDDEADIRAGEYIKESLWTFNPSFIIEHSDLPYAAEEMIADHCAKKCEGANETVEAIINDIDEFIEDAISLDGRGSFLNMCDGEEYEEGGFYIYQI